MIPNKEGKHPAFVNIAYHYDIANEYTPAEEIIDRGYALFSFCYENATRNNDDFCNGIAKYLVSKRRAKDKSGKLGLWAWAAMRIMYYIWKLDTIDKENVAVIGHSMLGKAALIAGGYDERFKYVISNNSGCSGAAISRGKSGESIEKITESFPFWFSKRYVEDAGRVKNFDFDQHFLLALCVPRHILIGSAEDDLWSDPTSEFLSLLAVNEAYRIYGKAGLVHNREIPTARCVLGEGDSAYHIRHGSHYLSREDWNVYMDYIDKHR